MYHSSTSIFAEAQLVRWPRTTRASVVAFGNAVLGLEECIAAYSVAYCKSEGCPEDILVFIELGEASQDDLALAASFVQRYFDLYADALGVAARYVEDCLEAVAA